MKWLFVLTLAIACAALNGCVIAPVGVGYGHGYGGHYYGYHRW